MLTQFVWWLDLCRMISDCNLVIPSSFFSHCQILLKILLTKFVCSLEEGKSTSMDWSIVQLLDFENHAKTFKCIMPFHIPSSIINSGTMLALSYR